MDQVYIKGSWNASPSYTDAKGNVLCLYETERTETKCQHLTSLEWTQAVLNNLNITENSVLLIYFNTKSK